MSIVTDYLSERGAAFQVIPHARTYSSIAEALAIGIRADEVLKSLLLWTRDGEVMVVIPASLRLDMRLVKEAVGDNHARLATEGEIQRRLPAYELGALPPLTWLVGIPTYVDPEVLLHETVVFADGSERRSVQARTQDLLRGAPVRVVPLTEAPWDAEMRSEMTRY
jgi:Ala-tRNA(Pro) deacylase